jgi:hypothetical protein
MLEPLRPYAVAQGPIREWAGRGVIRVSVSFSQPVRYPNGRGAPSVRAFGKIGVGTPNGAYSPARRRSPQITMPSPNEEGTDPRTRLQAITAEIRARRPRGSAAIKLLVEAASYLRGSGGGVLRQYGKARGCAPNDIAAAERTIMADRDRGRARPRPSGCSRLRGPRHAPSRRNVVALPKGAARSFRSRVGRAVARIQSLVPSSGTEYDGVRREGA